LDKLEVAASALPVVPKSEVEAYRAQTAAMTELVSSSISSEPRFNELVGAGRLEMMRNNHQNHADFMAAVFALNDYRLLARTLVWVYRAYHNHGFSYDYFPVELKAWLSALSSQFGENGLPTITAVYNWILEHHSHIVSLAQEDAPDPVPLHPDWQEPQRRFLTAALQGNTEACTALLDEYTQTPDDIEAFYEHVIQAAMYEIGLLWERSEISVAEEHLASAIVTRVMANTNARLSRSPSSEKKVVVTAAPNEYHEIGAWMIADVLAQDGWNVLYLGANTPQADLLRMLYLHNPLLLAVSVTMPYNLVYLKALIEDIRSSKNFEKLRILVGGGVFKSNPGLWQSVGADAFAGTLAQAKKTAEELVRT